MRVLLKISGEALAGKVGVWLDYSMLERVTKTIKILLERKIQVWVVVGAGNLIRGAEMKNIDRCNADNMWMLAININTIALSDVLRKNSVGVTLVNSFWIDGVVERFNKQKAIADIESGKVIMFGGGIWNPYFTTDTAGVLRALEIEADLMIKATKVDGVYTADPVTDKNAQFIVETTYDEVITKSLRVMDFTSIALAKENDMILKVVSLFKDGAILRAIEGKEEGSTIKK